MNLLKKSFQYTVLFTLFLSLLLGLRLPSATAAAGGAAPIDAVLVLDVSYSMDSSDREKIGNEAMKMFIDMLSEKGDRVGVVAYTDKIQREKALLEIRSPEDKQNLKSFIDQLNRGSYTDVSVGLKEAVQILKDGAAANANREPIIILLADGNDELDPKSGRTEAQSNEEREQAVRSANDNGIPIYTIGLNADGKLNKAALEELSKETGGKSFVTDSADDLPQILSEIFASHLELNIVPVNSFTANGDFQDVKITVPNSNVLEANISIMSSKPVEAKLVDPSGNAVAIPSDEVVLATSKSYTLLKLIKPVQGDWTLKIKGVDQDKIDINLIFNYDLTLELEPLATTNYSKGDKVKLNAFLASKGQRLSDAEQYRNMNAVMFVKDLTTGNSEEVAMKLDGDHFAGEYKIPESRDYEIIVRAEEQSFFRESEPMTISASSGGTGGTATPAEEADDKPFPIWTVVIAAVVVLALLGAGYWVWGMMKERSRGFVGQMIIEIRDENTGDKSSPQYKRLSHFKGKFQLHQLLQLAPELKETEKIVFKPANKDRIALINGSLCKVEKSGRAVGDGRQLELQSGDRITVSLTQVDKTIYIEYLV
ncbi:VWA domain-containing protein [Paenibacillus sp. 1011MAR3C5]|uniref:vWA domain-containing protein n=1 Tax=Paenibacillus sp. 1011MAR3C5 TaxID=1675787 RepID=UPI000E6CE9E6|nr:vWA domain-containing protein [Paenibacillus sp. 1011MAR3C5]RJE89636.1 VWA domain-containing protein [Paenibacillus sp. 1011MAR3C5]